VSEDNHSGTLLVPVRVDRSTLLGRLVIGPLTLLLLMIILVFYVLFDRTSVDGDSMQPTLEHGDRLLMTKRHPLPERGDIVVFRMQERDGSIGGVIKRVVAVAGDSVESRGGLVVVNGVEEDPSAIIRDPRDPAYSGPIVIPEGTVYVLGDNRRISLDSRHIGPVPVDTLEGKVVFVWAPITRMGPPE
jgi:signal peptidase I